MLNEMNEANVGLMHHTLTDTDIVGTISNLIGDVAHHIMRRRGEIDADELTRTMLHVEDAARLIMEVNSAIRAIR